MNSCFTVTDINTSNIHVQGNKHSDSTRNTVMSCKSLLYVFVREVVLHISPFLEKSLRSLASKVSSDSINCPLALLFCSLQAGTECPFFTELREGTKTWSCLPDIRNAMSWETLVQSQLLTQGTSLYSLENGKKYQSKSGLNEESKPHKLRALINSAELMSVTHSDAKNVR